MTILQAIILGIIEGITEFLPISSTGHLTIAEKLMGMDIGSVGVTAFTAVIQIGAIAAALYYFRNDIWRFMSAWFAGLADKTKRDNQDYRMGWGIIIGSAPIAVVGLLFKHDIETTLRSLWLVAIALIGWSFVMWVADRTVATKQEKDIRVKDMIFIGFVQCLALVPGVSRSGATISAGLFRGFDRVTVTKLSFYLGIPALLAAGVLEAVTQASHISNGVGWPATIVATITSFIVGYASIAWLLRFVAQNTFTLFIVYRVALGLILIALLTTGVITA